MLELLTVVFIIGVLATIAVIGYFGYVDKAKVVTAKNELNMLEKEIYIWSLDKSLQYPPDLAAIEYDGFLDPWGRLYVYQPDLTVAPRLKAGNPINTDFDLYSRGLDGLSVQDIAAPESQDDIIRAGNGAYKGFAKGY